jgi:hypothetical protein
MIARPEPIAETSDTITFSRVDVERLFDALDDLETRAAFLATRDEERLPAEVVQRLCAGENPVKVLREHRGHSVAALAAAAHLSRSYLSEIEAGRKPGSAKALRALAGALEVSLDDLLP